MTDRRPTVVALLALAIAGCSSLAPLPTPQECESDEDCSAGELCAPDTRVCVPTTNLPPAPDLAFDVQELVGGQVVYRAEIAACDAAVSISQSRIEVKGTEVAQTFEVQVEAREPLTDPPGVEDLLPSAIEFSQASRFGRAPLVPPRVDYPRLDQSAEVATVLPTTLKWPRYHPFDPMPAELANGGFVQWRTIPAAGAPMLQMIVAPETKDTVCTDDLDCCDDEESCAPNFCVPGVGRCSAIGNPKFAFTYRYSDTCSRELTGEVVVIDGETLETRGVVADAPLTVRHADTEGVDRMGVQAIGALAPVDRPEQCDTDADCIVGEQFCEPLSHQCVLRLAGRTADNGSVRTDEGGAFVADVYTYCEGLPTEEPFPRSFTVSAALAGPLASLSYTFDAEIRPLQPGNQKPQARVPKRLCVPDWGASAGLSLRLVGMPRTLAGEDDGEYRCCDVGCLPRTPEELASSPPPQLETCDGRTSADLPAVTVSASLVLDEAKREAWEAADCVPPDATADDVVGGIRRSMDCSKPDEDATCFATDLAAGPDGSAREYRVRLESPVGSLFASMALDVDVTGDTGALEVPLVPRVLVFGRVDLDTEACAQAAPVDGECGSQSAVVRAERLRMPGETADNVLGPYVHEVSTFVDPITGRPGSYLLPLDPGVYLLTALPAAGSAGGPAAISVLDTRDGNDIERDLSLRAGVLVTLDLSGFDPRAQIVPLDRGSWRDLVHPGRAEHPDPARRVVDLNAIGECLQPSAEVPQACRIRRLTAANSLAASQVGQVRFLARVDDDAGSCP